MSLAPCQRENETIFLLHMVIDHWGKISVNKIHWLCQPLLPYLLQAGHWHLSKACSLALESYVRLQRKRCTGKESWETVLEKIWKKIKVSVFKSNRTYTDCIAFHFSFDDWALCYILNLDRMLCGIHLKKQFLTLSLA